MDKKQLEKELNELCYVYGDALKRAQLDTFHNMSHYADRWESRKEKLIDKILKDE